MELIVLNASLRPVGFRSIPRLIVCVSLSRFPQQANEPSHPQPTLDIPSNPMG
jgi:hypothetical protein